MSRRVAVLGACGAAMIFVACFASDATRERPLEARGVSRLHRVDGPALLSLPLPPPPEPARSADRVIVISIDGLRPDALDDETSPVLARLAREGVKAERARTIDRSSTLPSHASMLSGVDIARHGIDWNAWRPTRGRIRFPSIFRVAREAGLSTTLVVAKRKLEHILTGDDAERFQTGGVVCERVNRLAVPDVRSAAPGVHFIHFADVDSAGHTHGWMSRPYLQAVGRVDRCVGELVESVLARGDADRTLVLVTSDHGGHGKSHGTSEPIDTAIPWIAWGGPVRRDARVTEVDTRDTAATALAALGLAPPTGMEGRPVAVLR